MMPKTTPVYNFEARIWIIETDGVVQIETWSYELKGTDLGKSYPVDEWSHEHLCECYDNEDFRKEFELPETGNWQIIMKGTIQGGYDSYTGEGLEDMHILEFKTAPVSEEYVNAVFFNKNLDVRKD